MYIQFVIFKIVLWLEIKGRQSEKNNDNFEKVNRTKLLIKIQFTEILCAAVPNVYVSMLTVAKSVCYQEIHNLKTKKKIISETISYTNKKKQTNWWIN